MHAKQLLELHHDLCSTARDLMARKNHDYTSGSGDPFANFRGSSYLGIDPVLGVMLRMQDKLMRVRTFTEKGELKVKDEGVKDALVDLINYTVLMYGLIEDKKNTPATKTEDIDALEKFEIKRGQQQSSGVGSPIMLFSGASAREWHDANTPRTSDYAISDAKTSGRHSGGIG